MVDESSIYEAERADYVISLFWPMLEAAILYTLPLAVISFFCGLFIAVIVAVIRTLPSPTLPLKLFTGFMSSVYPIIRGTTDVSTNFIIFYGLPEARYYFRAFFRQRLLHFLLI